MRKHTSALTLAELHDARRQAEEEIAGLILVIEERFGAAVTSIDVDRQWLVDQSLDGMESDSVFTGVRITLSI